jgi:hypothetical protein
LPSDICAYSYIHAHGYTNSYSNAYTYGNRDHHTYGYTYRYAGRYTYTYAYHHAQGNADTQVRTNTAARSHSAASPRRTAEARSLLHSHRLRPNEYPRCLLPPAMARFPPVADSGSNSAVYK